MAYDEVLAERMRAVFANYEGIAEKTMFGGLSFQCNGKMCCGVSGKTTDMVVRLSPDQEPAALAKPHTRPCDFTGRPMRGWIYVAPEGLENDAALKDWIAESYAYVSKLPVK
ncbi:MAG: TfoX/Sxy family protein [Alphaproteobacteria bacterium]